MKGYLSKTLKLTDETVLIKTDPPQTHQFIVSRSNIQNCPDSLQHPTVVEFKVGDEKDEDENLIVLEARIIGVLGYRSCALSVKQKNQLMVGLSNLIANHEMTICRNAATENLLQKLRRKRKTPKSAKINPPS